MSHTTVIPFQSSGQVPAVLPIKSRAFPSIFPTNPRKMHTKYIRRVTSNPHFSNLLVDPKDVAFHGLMLSEVMIWSLIAIKEYRISQIKQVQTNQTSWSTIHLPFTYHLDKLSFTCLQLGQLRCIVQRGRGIPGRGSCSLSGSKSSLKTCSLSCRMSKPIVRLVT